MKNNLIENKFLILAILFGLISILILPPFQSPDELSHYQRAYSVSQGQLFYSVKKGKIGLYIDDELSQYISTLDRLGGNVSEKYSYSDLYFDQEMPKKPSAKSFKYFSTVETSFIAYIPSAIGILVSKVFRHFIFQLSTTYLYSLYFARLFNLLVYIVLMYYSIKKTPILKKTMVTIGLLPMSIMLSSSCSYDGLIIGAACLLFAYAMNLIHGRKKEFDYKDMIVFIVTGFLLFFIKYVYILLLLLLFFIPEKKFKNKKDKYIKICSVFCIVFLLYLIFNIPNYINAVPGSPNEQIKFIMNNPFKYLGILFDSMYKKFGIQLAWILGGFGNLDTHFPGFIYFVMFNYLILLFLFDSSARNIKKDYIFKIIVFLIVFSIIAGIYTALYVIWTPVGNKIIEGVQGRYFIPILIYIPLISYGNKLSQKFTKTNQMLCENYISFSTTFLILYCIMLLLRFWC